MSCVIPSPVTLSNACVKYCAAVFVVCTVLSCACMLYVQYCPVVVCCMFSIVPYVQYCPVVVCCMYSIVLWLCVVCTVLSCGCMLYVQYCLVVVCCMYSIVLWLYVVCTVLSCGCMLYVQYSPPLPSLAVQGRLSWQSRWLSMSTVRRRRPSLDWTCPSTSRSLR